MRLRKVKNIEEKIKQCADVIVFNPDQQKGKWNELFNNNNPIYLEIGMGKGKFIYENAISYPNINFIGCEIVDSVIYKAATKFQKNKPDNLLLINIDARCLKDCFEKGEIAKIFLNFSDPWPKSRHEKRRLTSTDFINVYREVIVDKGIIEFKTDNQHLFEYSVVSFNQNNLDFLELHLSLHEELKEGEEDRHIITTEYEEKFKGLGQPIYFIKVRFK